MDFASFLKNAPTLQISKQIAKTIGLSEALVLQKLHEQLNKPDAMVVREGYTWVRSTYEQWHESFPFWSIIKIKRIFNRLEKAGLIITAQFDKYKWDRNNYYRIDYPALGDLSNYLLDGKGVEDEQ